MAELILGYGPLTTSKDSGHTHSDVELDQAGNGFTSVYDSHSHKVVNWAIQKAGGHKHKLIDGATGKVVSVDATTGRPPVKENKVKNLQKRLQDLRSNLVGSSVTESVLEEQTTTLMRDLADKLLSAFELMKSNSSNRNAAKLRKALVAEFGDRSEASSPKVLKFALDVLDKTLAALASAEDTGVEEACGERMKQMTFKRASRGIQHLTTKDGRIRMGAIPDDMGEGEAPKGTPELAGRIASLAKGVIGALSDDDASNQDAVELLDQIEKDVAKLKDAIGTSD